MAADLKGLEPEEADVLALLQRRLSNRIPGGVERGFPADRPGERLS